LKGHDDLLAVAPGLARQFPGLRFLLVGDGPWRERLEKKARTAGLEKNFIFAGLAPPDEVCRYVGIMDVLAHLSLREGLPRALPQALAAGKPVVAYDCDGAGEVCLDGQTGFLVPPSDLDLLAKQLGRLLADAPLRRELGLRGRKMALDLFPTEKMVDALENLYHELAAELPPAQRP
jgi:glycosyltransferase involved in cell wall biosynthesis